MRGLIDAEAHLDGLKRDGVRVRCDSMQALVDDLIKVHPVELLDASEATLKAEGR